MTDWAWYAPNGEVLAFTVADGHGTSVEVADIAGDGPPAQDIVQTPLYAGGSRILSARARERSLYVTLNIEAPLSRFLSYWREVVNLFTCTRVFGDGRFRVIPPNGEWRELTCRYASGLEDGYSDGALIGFTRPVVELLAADPYWYGQSAELLSFGYGTSQDFLSPFLSLSALQALGTQELNINGDSEAWPVWTFIGPFDTATMTTRGRSFSVTGPDSGALVLTTDPRNRGLYTAGGDVAFESLVRPADIWSLLPGEQFVTIELLGAGEGAQVLMSYRPRWQTP